ncbi:MAG: DUF1173 domain-containing protein [Burkholderiaceae bacterium]|nr:DUF1173 domain-containing protein [Burkholderiaceae bacterium]
MIVQREAAETAGRRAAYLVDGRRFETGSPGFVEAIAAAHAARQRPRCLCLVEGIEMYIARLAGTSEGYIVKRMPDTGSHHAPDCPSYEPPPEASGLGQVLGSAITEDPVTGETMLKLDFPLAKMPGRSTMPHAGSEGDSVSSTGTKLSLRGLLHYLWDQAELTRWHPGFAGKRTWATVRRHLLQAAEHKLARGDALRARLYVPEPFTIDRREAISARRLTQWQHVVATPGKPQRLMLLIGEVKEIVPARFGFKAIVKHMPDQAFAIDEQLYRLLGRCFEPELALWGATDDIHMVMVATFGVSSAGVPAIVEMSLMPVTAQWLPIEDSFERQLVEHLVADGRAFIKGLRYNLHREQRVATATLTDTGDTASLMFVVSPGLEGVAVADGTDGAKPRGDAPVWVWKPASEAMPRFPLTHLAATTGVPAPR